MSLPLNLTRRVRAALFGVLLIAALGLVTVPGHGQSATLVFDTAFEGEIWQQLPKFGHASSCFDFDSFLPIPSCAPSQDDLLYPVDVAIFQGGALGANGFPSDPLDYRVYATDSFNNRVVVFRYDPAAADDDPNDGYGWAPLEVPGAQWNAANLIWPDHVTVDAGGNVYVADYGNNRAVVFDPAGQILAVLPVGLKVYGIDATAGTAWGVGGTIAVNGIDFGSGVNSLVFYDATTGAELDRYQAPVGDFIPGGLTLATGIAYDGDSSHLVVADYGATRVVVFNTDSNGLLVDGDPTDGTIPNSIDADHPVGRPTMTPALVFGRPADFSDPSPADLQSPFSVNVDARGRILVGDTDNQRLAVYQPVYPEASPATSTFQFELNAEGGLNGYPRGLTEDAVGRLIVVDTVNHEVEVFQVPDIAIVDVEVIGPRSSAPEVLRPQATIGGSFVAGDPISVEFTVMVPETQFQVTDATPTCQATDANGVIPVDAGPTLIGWTADVLGDPQADFAADGDIDAVRPAPLDLYRFSCQFTARVEGAVSFDLTAVGNGGVTASQDRQSTAIVGCAACETGVPSATGAVVDPLPARQFYDEEVTVELNAVDQEDLVHPEDPRASLPPTGIKRTYWQWVYGPLAFYDPSAVECADHPGTTIQCDGAGLAEGDPVGFTYPLSYDVQVPVAADEDSEGYNTLEFWTVDAAGNPTERQSLTVSIDVTPPTTLFAFPDPTGQCWVEGGLNHCWYNTDVTAPYNLFDSFTPGSLVTVSGSTGPFSPLVFNQDGENPAVSLFDISDLAGNVFANASSADALLNGRVVHIDRVAPVTTFSCTWTDGTTTLDCSAGGSFPGGIATFSLPASDDVSGVRETYSTMSGAASHAVMTLAPVSTHTLSNSGTTTVTFWSTDLAGNVATPVTVDLLLNQPPVAADDTFTLWEDQGTAAIGVLGNDVDPDGDLLTVTVATPPVNGTAQAKPDRTIGYAPNPDFAGVDTFTYTIDDNHGGSSSATVTVSVTAKNDPPIAVADAASTPEDVPLVLAPSELLANDIDVDAADTMTVVSTVGAVNGTVAIVSGQVVFTPAADFHGPASFTYTSSDGNGSTSSAPVFVTVTTVNDAPVASPDTASTPEDTPVAIDAATLLANDADVDGDALAVVSVANPVHGTVLLGGGQAAFTPDADFHGTASFDYTISDSSGGVDTTVVTITLTPVNDSPVAVDDAASTVEDTSVTIDAATLLTNDSDLDGDTLTVQSVAGGIGGTASLVAGQVTFTPATDFTGQATFTYTLTDGTGTATATVTVTVTGVNDAPVATDDVATTPEDTSLVLDPSALLGNDVDADGDTLTVSAVSDAIGGTVAIVSGQIVFMPMQDASGPASFTYTVSDGNGGVDTATVAVTITPVNDGPVANPDTASTSEDTTAAIDPAMLLANDTDADGDALTIESVGNAVNGTVLLMGGQVTFTPAADFSGTASFEYTISDGHGGTATAKVSVTVTGVNDAPDANDDTATTFQDAPLTIASATLLGNDVDTEGDALGITAVGSPVNGVVVLAGGQVVFTPAPGFAGQASFTYTVADGHGGFDTATVTILVTPLNQVPIAADDSYTAAFNQPVTVPAPGVLGNDIDTDGPTDLAAELVTPPATGSLTLSLDGSFTFVPATGFSGLASFTYRVSDGAAASGPATVTVVVEGPNCEPASEAGALVRRRTRFNGSSVVEGSVHVMTGADVTFNGSATLLGDLLIAGTPTVVINGQPASYGGTVDGSGAVSPTNHQVTINGGTTLGQVVRRTDPVALPVVTAPPASGGTRNVAMNQPGDDPGDFTTIRDLTLNGHVGPLAVPPGTYRTFIANGNNGFIIGDPAATTPVVYNFQALRLNGNSTLQVVGPVIVTIRDAVALGGMVGAVGHPEWLALRIASSGGLKLNGAASFYGYVEAPNGPVIINGGTRLVGGLTADTLTLNGNGKLLLVPQVADGCAPANVPPVAGDSVFITPEGTAYSGTVAATDPDGDPLTFVSASGPGHGSVAVSPDGAYTYTPAAGYDGPDSFGVTVDDGNGGTVTVTVNITVTAVNHAPVAVFDAATTKKGDSVRVPVLANDSDLDGDVLTIDSVGPALHGTATVYGKQVKYVPQRGFTGTDAFTYTISDGNGGTATATVTVVIAAKGKKDHNDDGHDSDHGSHDGWSWDRHDGDDRGWDWDWGHQDDRDRDRDDDRGGDADRGSDNHWGRDDDNNGEEEPRRRP